LRLSHLFNIQEKKMPYQEPPITLEDDADLELYRVVKLDSAAPHMVAYAGADEQGIGVIIGQEGSAAPYLYTVETRAGYVVQCVSDGSGAIDEGDKLASAASGKVKKRTIADGTTTRYWVGIALSAAAATDGLLVDVLWLPQHASNT
jgi:hypothetical protein